MSDYLLEELDDLVRYVAKNVKVNCGLGDKDIAPDQYPYIKIIPDLEFSVFFNTVYITFEEFPVTMKIVASRENERDVLDVLLRFLRVMNRFNHHKGHKIGDVGTPEYTDNTYEISIPFVMKISTE